MPFFRQSISILLILLCLLSSFASSSMNQASENKVSKYSESPLSFYDMLKKTADKYEKNQDEKLLSQLCTLALLLDNMENQDGIKLDAKISDFVFKIKENYFEKLYTEVTKEEFAKHIKQNSILNFIATQGANSSNPANKNVLNGYNLLYHAIVAEYGKLLLNKDPSEFSGEFPELKERLAESRGFSFKGYTDKQLETVQYTGVFSSMAINGKVKLNDAALAFADKSLRSMINENHGMEPEKADKDEFFAVLMSYFALREIYDMQNDETMSKTIGEQQKEFMDGYRKTNTKETTAAVETK